MNIREWAYDEVAWGETDCACGCMKPAQLLYDGVPLTIECADLLLERQQAIAIAPRLREQLPWVWEGPRI